jgi:membrane protease YdiL (CAAX protease family)
MGPERWSWGRDGVAVLAALVFPTVATWLYFDTFAGRGVLPAVTYGAAKVLEAAFPLIWVVLVQRRRPALARPGGAGVAVGLVFGAAVLVAMLGLFYGYLKASPVFAGTDARIWAKIHDLGADTPGRYLALALFISVAHAALEEYYWRWFVFGQLRRGLPVGWAILVASVGFTLHHVVVLAKYLPPAHFWTATVAFSAGVGVGGAFWCWLYHRTGSLLGPWLGHAVIDAGILAIGYDLCAGYWG